MDDERWQELLVSLKAVGQDLSVKAGRHRMLSGLDAFGTFNLQRFPDAPGIFGGVHKDDVAVAKLRLLLQ